MKHKLIKNFTKDDYINLETGYYWVTTLAGVLCEAGWSIVKYDSSLRQFDPGRWSFGFDHVIAISERLINPDGK